MSDTSGLPNANAEGVPEEDVPERFEDTEAAEPPPADFDPAQQPSNPDLVKNTDSVKSTDSDKKNTEPPD